MNIKKLLVLAPVAVLSLTSCGKTGVRHEARDYFIKAKNAKYDVTGKTGISILQLSDLHLGTNCDRKVQYAFIQETINQANQYIKDNPTLYGSKEKVDLIVITGDVFTFGTKEIAKDFVNFMEGQNIDWTLTFGNHDEQCYFSVDWLTSYLNEIASNADSHLLFKDNQDDDVFGNANFVISIDGDETAKEKDVERLYIFDSNRYRYQFSGCGYDYIHHDQIDWYERMARTDLAENSKTPEIDPIAKHSLAFFHIPFEEFNTYYEEALKHEKGESEKAVFKTDEGGEHKKLDKQAESVSCPKENTHLYQRFFDLNSTKGVFVGHDHINNSAVEVKEESADIVLSFGVKGTDTVYADDDLIGGQIIHISGERTFTASGGIDTDKTIGIHPVLHKYSELKEVK